MKYIKSFKIFENKKFCHGCGSELGLGDRFCDQCGRRQDMSYRPKSDDEKFVLAKLNDDKIDLKEKIKIIISAYEKNLIQHLDLEKKANYVISEYLKKFGFADEFYKKANKLATKNFLVGTIEFYKSRSQDPEYRKMLDSLIDEFHDKDVDDYDTTSAFTKALLLDAANSSIESDRRKPWKDEYLRIANNFKKDEKGFSNSATLMGQIISLDMMTAVAHKYPEHKHEFDKIFQEFLKHNKTSDLLKKTWEKESEIKKKKNNSGRRLFDCFGREVKEGDKGLKFDSSGKEVK